MLLLCRIHRGKIMASELNESSGEPGSSTFGSGYLTPDAGPDISRADYSADYPSDSNDSLHDDENVDVPGPDSNEPGENVVDRQLGSISQLPG
jgi:hypothetical protein